MLAYVGLRVEKINILNGLNVYIWLMNSTDSELRRFGKSSEWQLKWAKAKEIIKAVACYFDILRMKIAFLFYGKMNGEY